jgi:hypothetical protein
MVARLQPVSKETCRLASGAFSSDAAGGSGAGAEETVVPLFLIERNFAETVQTDPETMAIIKEVNDEIGIQWLFSFLSADKRKTYCLYEAPNADLIRAAARRLGVPADTIVEVGSELGPYAAAIAPLREHVREGSPPPA